MSVLQKRIFKDILIFNVFGWVYFLIEILYRGYSHPTMVVLGGLCGLLIGLIDEHTPKMPIIVQMLLGSIIIIVLEFLAGCILNIKFGLGIWDYSNLRFDFMGQICLEFWVCWFLLSLPVIKIDNYLRSYK